MTTDSVTRRTEPPITRSIPHPVADAVRELLAGRDPGHCLPGPMYSGPETYAADLAHVWHREWVFAGHEGELTGIGDYITLTVGEYPVVVVRGVDGVVRALHNVCRHRGALICSAPSGSTRRKFVCPYHQWAYELDGSLYKARTWPDLDPTGLGMRPAHCALVAGLVFICVAGEAPPVDPLRALLEPYLGPFRLATARVAAESVIVEQGNWKLVMENNRECYHCAGAHPELARTFPLAPLHSGGGSDDDARATNELVAACERAGLPSTFRGSPDNQVRVMRMALEGGARSMTMDGAPAVGRRFAGLPDDLDDVGDVLLYHYPSMWSHFLGDHVVTFRLLPTGPRTTQLRTTWLVPQDAVEGVDYDAERLTEVWRRTNEQDAALVGRAQLGVASPAFVPGPYAPVEEEGVEQFVAWYAGVLGARLAGTDGIPSGHGSATRTGW
jgi:phenylpropionate dioxygenase-like ring-hydroxylating dioxygenase large terminal subunit